MRILIFLTAIASFLFGSAAFSHALAKADFKDLRETYKGKITKIISPMAVQMDNGKIVRLSGIYMPDFNETAPGPFSLIALEILKDSLIGQNVTLYQTPDNNTGRINRMGHEIAHIIRDSDDLWIQGVLLSLGLAVVQTTPTNSEMQKEMLEQEEKARTENLGLWKNQVQILSPLELQPYIGSFQIVEGKVHSAALKKNILYLNFGKNWRNDFTVTIESEAKRAFSKQGINPLDWNGKILRVRGWLQEHNGPSMKIDHPQAIEVLPSDSTKQPKILPPENQKASDPASIDNVLPPLIPQKQ